MSEFLLCCRRQSAWLALSTVLTATCYFGLLGIEPVTTEGLLKEMVDLRRLAEFPVPYYDCDQFSSYDRRSIDPSDPEGWFANADRGQYLRVEEKDGRREYVMMDAAGPGAIVRIWSANPDGTIRIYLDDQTKPALEAPMQVLLGGQFPGIPEPLACLRSRGWNLYFPIPYAHRCVVTSDKGDLYYHVDYRTYEVGTEVRTFNINELQQLQDLIQSIARRLSEPDRPLLDDEVRLEQFTINLEPDTRYVARLRGPAAICRVDVRATAAEMEEVLRQTVLRVFFDEELCIETPLGDFFGTGPGLNWFRSLPVGVDRGGHMYSQWFMPFKESARIELANWSTQNIQLIGQLALVPYQWTDRSMHFHAKWKASYDLPTRPMRDWNYVDITGTGTFVGVAFGIDNPSKAWWGEGDEKIYVDDDTFPSFFGTGTEDYYGYAWGSTELFTHAYHSQSRCDGPANYGRTAVNRFHIIDSIPFRKRFRFDMEIWHWDEQVKVNLWNIAYWYAKPGAKDSQPNLSPEMVKLRPMPRYERPRVQGAIEGEQMRIVSVRGIAEPQEWAGLSGEQHLWWHAGMGPGDQLVLAFAVPEGGRYRVFARFLTARDYGVHKLAINGREVGPAIDFYSPEVKPTLELLLGEFDLWKGENYLTVTVTGSNPKAIHAYMFGLDYIRLEKVQ